MTALAIVILLIGFVAVFAQFGGRVAARDSLVWWFVATFVVVAAIKPEVYRPVAQMLGIKFVSNFVLAGMILFLFVHILAQSVASNEIRRRLRSLISVEAAIRFQASRALRKADERASILVALPCLNEEASLEGIIRDLRNLPPHPEFQVEFCIINDGSIDSSEEILTRMAPQNYVSHPINTGVAGVLMTAFEIGKRGRFDWVVQCDSDGQHPINGIYDLVEQAYKSKFDLLVGSRYARIATGSNSIQLSPSSTITRRFGGLAILALLRILGPSKLRVSDPTSGFRAYSRQAFCCLLVDMPDDYPEPESIFILASRGYSIGETKVQMNARMAGRSSIFGFGTFLYMVKVVSAIIGLKLRSLVLASRS